MDIKRRAFLRLAGTAGITGILSLSGLTAGPLRKVVSAKTDNPERHAMLFDATRCIGCRRCEEACDIANDLPEPEVKITDRSVFNEVRRTDPTHYTVVNRYDDATWEKPVFRKLQCNHCAEPACASACPVAALKKTPSGAVIWDENLCIGCRYCMTACPFYIPTFEYDDPLKPAIVKCNTCHDRLRQGMLPACAEKCTCGALTFGKRSEVLTIARRRIIGEPQKYRDHIYGEYEIGGTDWLYISGVPFEKLGLPENLGSCPLPQKTMDFLSSVPLVLLIWPALFSGFYAFTKRRERLSQSDGDNQLDRG